MLGLLDFAASFPRNCKRPGVYLGVYLRLTELNPTFVGHGGEGISLVSGLRRTAPVAR